MTSPLLRTTPLIMDSPMLLTGKYQQHVDKLEEENLTLRRLLARETGGFMRSQKTGQNVPDYQVDRDQIIETLVKEKKIAEENLEQTRRELQDLKQRVGQVPYQTMDFTDPELQNVLQKAELQTQIDKLEGEKQELLRTLEDAMKSAESAVGENEDLRQQIKNLLSENQLLKKDNEELPDYKNVEEMVNALDVATRENESLKEENQHLKQHADISAGLSVKLDHANALVSDLSNERDQLQDELRRIFSAVDEKDAQGVVKRFQTMAGIEEELETENENLGQEIDQLRQTMKEMQDKNEKLQQRNTFLEEEMSSIKQKQYATAKTMTTPVKPSPKTTKMMKDNESMKVQLAQLKKDLDSLAAERDSLRSKLEADELLETQSSSLLKSNMDKDDEIATLKAENQELNEALTSKTAETEQLRRLIDSQQETIHAYEQKQVETAKFRSENNKLKEELQRAKRANGAQFRANILRLMREKTSAMFERMSVIQQTSFTALDSVDTQLQRITRNLPRLMKMSKVYPLSSLRSELVRFIEDTKVMMRDLRRGATACIKAAATSFARHRILGVPLTYEQRANLIGLEDKYKMEHYIKGIVVDESDEVKDDVSGYSPIAAKHRHKGKQAVEADTAILGKYLHLLVTTIWEVVCKGEPCPDVITLVHKGSWNDLRLIIDKVNRLFMNHVKISERNVRSHHPAVVDLIGVIRTQVQSSMETLGSQHRQLMETIEHNV